MLLNGIKLSAYFINSRQLYFQVVYNVLYGKSVVYCADTHVRCARITELKLAIFYVLNCFVLQPILFCKTIFI